MTNRIGKTPVGGDCLRRKEGASLYQAPELRRWPSRPLPIEACKERRRRWCWRQPTLGDGGQSDVEGEERFETASRRERTGVRDSFESRWPFEIEGPTRRPAREHRPQGGLCQPVSRA
ncbi:hypothetical protein HPB48_013571 [Haemaphysalis longicornis]|uniref:Uncharacterized protein n=1 Tax=Haemaphysalis longicornis TaxID=44386 RepID=A0A9J6H5K5_HAELO|nr:hypothetical protein HPB48_013571 [Haemaphysalis longicornis]